MKPIAASPSEPGLAPKTQVRTRSVAAKRFEAELVRQFVSTMMSGVFENGMSGQQGISQNEGMASRKDLLVDQVSEFIVERGGFGLANRILQQWQTQFGGEDPAPSPQKKTNSDIHHALL